jgi:hypothetical protein
LEFLSLTAAPDVGAGKIVMGTTFKLASNLTDSFAIYKYLTGGGFRQAVYGAIVERIQAVFDGTKSTMIAMQGPAAAYGDETTHDATTMLVQDAPADWTPVGAPLAGLTGGFYVDDAAFPVLNCQITVANNAELRNKEIGVQYASGIAGRGNKRRIQVSLTCYFEDVTLIDKANKVELGCLRLVVGTENGKMLAAVLPTVEFEIPTISLANGPGIISFDGVAYAAAGNDALYLGEA